MKTHAPTDVESEAAKKTLPQSESPTTLIDHSADGVAQKKRQQHANRHTAQALQPLAQRKAILQRLPVGLSTDGSTDNDRASIQVADVVGTERVNIKGDKNGAAQILNDFIVGTANGKDQKLKHYMVVKNGSLYQFPIKHLKQPRDKGTRRHPGPYAPNQGASYGARAGQPEGFGGNTDLAKDVTHNDQLLTDTRKTTLEHEYTEENHAHGGATLTVGKSKKFAGPFGAGTLSIATTDKPLAEGTNAHDELTDQTERGKAEMKGTVVINCDDLINGILIDDDLEIAIGNKIQAQRDALYGDPTNTRSAESIFAREGGILAHLVGMVKEDIIAQRLERQQVALLREQERLRQEELARQEQERLKQEALAKQEQERVEQEKLAKQKQEQERIEQERKQQEEETRKREKAALTKKGLAIGIPLAILILIIAILMMRS